MLAIPEKEPAASRWATRASLFAFGLVIAALFLHRLFGMPTPVAYNVALLGMALAVTSILAATIAAAIIWHTGRPGTARVLFAVCLSLALLAAPLLYIMWEREFPLLSDITTDTANPPEFSAVARLRGPGDNSTSYNTRRWAAEQRRAYPDIEPMTIARPSDEAFGLVVGAMKRLKMDIVREDAPEPEGGTQGAVEAVDRTLIMGFYQDVAVRVTGIGDEETRVDMRSASRFGHGDMGRNAERLRELRKEIQARVDATMPTAQDAREQAKRSKQEKAGGPKSENRRKSRDRGR